MKVYKTDGWKELIEEIEATKVTEKQFGYQMAEVLKEVIMLIIGTQ